jgi:archaetidylinositol phosphate synthase
VGSRLARLPLSPGGWTLLALASGLATVPALAAGSLAAAGLLYLLSGFCDLADGAVARQRGRVSRRGAYLDTLADRAVDAAPLFGLLLVPLPPLGMPAHYWLFLYLFLSMMVTYAKAAAREKGLVERELPGAGILERPERCLILSAGLIAGGFEPGLVVYALALLTGLAALSLAQRVHAALAAGRGRG